MPKLRVVLLLGMSLALTPRAAPPALASPAGARLHPTLPLSGPVFPLWFEPNRGQAPESVRFLVHGPGSTLLLTDHGIREQGGGALTFLGARPHPSLSLGPLLPGRVNYFLGSDPARWLHDLPTYGSLTYHQLYPGIDLVLGEAGGRLTSHWLLHPGANPARIRLRLSSLPESRLGVPRAPPAQNPLASRIRLARAPALPSAPPMLLPLHPEGRETLDGRTTRLGVRYRVQAGGPATVEVNAHNPQGSVTIGPVVGFSTYLGGRGVDEGFGVTLDSTQHIVVAGDTNSSDFPTVRAMEGLSSGGAGQSDLFIAKLGADGRTLLYSTYIGGSGFDHAYDVAVDGAGNACVAGDTLSRDFPLANPVQATHAGGDDAVVVEISSAGDRLLFSSYLGGRGDDSAASLAVSPSGRVYVTGTTQSVDFPTVNALQSHSSRGDSDAFLSELDPATGKITYSTYLGGTGSDEATALALDATGNVYLTGLTTSVDFPTRRAVETYVAGLNTFVTKIDASGRSIVYSTYLGGPGTTIGFGIAVDSAGSAYVVGDTNSESFPTEHALQPHYGGDDSSILNGDAFLAKLSPDGASLVYSTYLGGKRDDWANGVSVDAAGNVFLVGETNSADFPAVNAIQPVFAGATCHDVTGAAFPCSDAFIAEVDASGTHLLWSTFLGGSGDDSAYGLALGSRDAIYVVGNTDSGDFPTDRAYQDANRSARRAAEDVFIASLAEGTRAPAQPSIAIQQAGVYHRVQGQMLRTGSMRKREVAHFEVSYRDAHVGSYVISGRIAIRRAGHVLYEDWMTRLVSPNATNAFQDEIHLRPHWTGHLVAQFTIRIGDTIARRSIDFDVKG